MITLYGFQFSHHGQNSAFTALAREMAADTKVIDVTPRLVDRLPRRIRNRLRGPWFEGMEWRVWNEFGSRDVSGVHYFFPENSLFRGHRWKGDKRLILTCHQPASPAYFARVRTQSPFFSDGMAQADDIVLMSSVGTDLYRETFPKARVSFIPYGVDVSFFKAKEPRLGTRALPTFRLLTVGNWLRDYRFWAAVGRGLKMQGVSVELTVIASADTLLEVRALATASRLEARLLSEISDLELRNEYERADLLFLPLKDGWANTAVMEGMAMGLPIAVTDLPASREYLGDDATMYFTLESPEETAMAIAQLLHDSQRLGASSRALRARAEQRYAWSVIAGQHRALYAGTTVGTER